MDNKDIFYDALNDIRSLVPKYSIVSKKKSFFHKLIGFLLFFNSRYMESFWTTIGYTTAFPGDSHNYDWRIIYHEGMHALQCKRLSRPLMSLLYLFPQCLMPIPIILVSVGLLSPWFLLLSFLFMMPLPAYFRMKFELQAYVVSMYLDNCLNKNIQWEIMRNRYLKQFTGPNYYFMWPFVDYMTNELYKNFTSIKNGDKIDNIYFPLIEKTLKRNGVINE